MPATKAQRSTAARKGAATRKRHAAESKAHEQVSAVDRTTELSGDVFTSLESGQRAAIEAVRKFVDTVDEKLPTNGEGSVEAAGHRRRRYGDGRPTGPHAVRLPSQRRAKRREWAA